MVSSNNINKISSHSFDPGKNSTRDSETDVPIALRDNNKKIRKIRGRGKRGKELRYNIRNFVDGLRNFPPCTIGQTKNKVSSQNLANYLDPTSWKPNDLNYIFCNTPVTGKKQLPDISAVKRDAYILFPEECRRYLFSWLLLTSAHGLVNAIAK